MVFQDVHSVPLLFFVSVYMPLKECVERLGDRFEDYMRMSYRLGDIVHPVLATHPFSEDIVSTKTFQQDTILSNVLHFQLKLAASQEMKE